MIDLYSMLAQPRLTDRFFLLWLFRFIARDDLEYLCLSPTLKGVQEASQRPDTRQKAPRSTP